MTYRGAVCYYEIPMFGYILFVSIFLIYASELFPIPHVLSIW